MAVDVDTLGMLRTEPEIPEADLSWLDLDTTWGVQAKPGKRGLTLDEINIGVYGDVPDTTTNYGFRPRGAAARREAPRSGMPYPDKADTWAQNAALLYEEAVARQWSSATDIPWEELDPLPDDLEQAFCQFCTFLTEVEFIAGDTPGQWLPHISSDYYEAKLFLATQIVDEARHLDVFRKRALANGGGLLEQGFGNGLRNIIDAKDFTEMSALMHVVGEGFVQSIFRMGEYIAQNEVEKRIFRLCGQDESRHLAFGVMHLKYVLETQPWRREEIHSYLDKAEGGQQNEGITTSRATSESLAILMGGGKHNADEGIRRLMAARKRQINEYMHRLEVAGLADRRERISPAMQPFLDPAKN